MDVGANFSNKCFGSGLHVVSVFIPQRVTPPVTTAEPPVWDSKEKEHGGRIPTEDVIFLSQDQLIILKFEFELKQMSLFKRSNVCFFVFFSGMLNIEPLLMTNHIHVLSHIHYQ